jgi:hypothetical protein
MLVLQNWLRSLGMPEKRRLRIAVSGLVLWLRSPLYGEVIKRIVYRRWNFSLHLIQQQADVEY